MTIQVSGDALELIPKLKDDEGLSAALRKAMKGENGLTVSHIQRQYLSLPKDGPTSLNGLRIISNRLRPSLNASEPQGDIRSGIQSSIGSNVVYARILEEGGVTRPHKIVARNARALSFKGLFRRSVNHPGSKIEGRHYVRRGISDRLDDYGAVFTRTILRFWKGT